MALQKIEEVYFYFSDSFGSAAENIRAAAIMENSNVPFQKFYYNSLTNTEELFNNLNSWWTKPDGTGLPELNQFPFLTYVEVHDDIPARMSPVKYVQGADEIQNFITFYNTVNK